MNEIVIYRRSRVLYIGCGSIVKRQHMNNKIIIIIIIII